MFSDLNFFLQLFIIITSLLSLLLIGLPIGFCMGTVGFVGLYLIADFQFALNSFSIFLTSTPMNFTLIAIPLFTLMAQIIIFCDFGYTETKTGFPSYTPQTTILECVDPFGLLVLITPL